MGEFLKSDFDERIRRAAQQFSQKVEAEEGAARSIKEMRREFLIGFQLEAKKTIEPILLHAKRQTENSAASARVRTAVLWSPNENSISLTLRPTNKQHFHCLSFRADSMSMIVWVVRVFSSGGVDNLEEAAHKVTGEEVSRLKAGEIEGQEQRIADWVADFITESLDKH
jgi:hypothetical protein